MHIETNAFHLSSCFAASGIKSWLVFFFFSYACHEPLLVSHETASSSSSSAECSRDKPPFSFVRGHDSTMWDQGHRLSLATRTQISVCKSPFPSASTAMSLFHAKTVQQRPLLPREVETRLPDLLEEWCWTLIHDLELAASIHSSLRPAALSHVASRPHLSPHVLPFTSATHFIHGLLLIYQLQKD